MTAPPRSTRRIGARRPAARPALVLRLPSRTAWLSLVRDVTQRVAEHAGFDAATSGRLALAVDEATTNAIEHAYAGAADREVELRIDDRPEELRIDVVDAGRPIDLRSMPRVDLERYKRERRTGGLGVHLMEKIMDSVTFRRLARRNVCRLVKRRPARDAG